MMMKRKFKEGGRTDTAYQNWRNKLPKNLQYEGDYDLYSFWKENPTWSPDTPGAHMTDKYKLPNHPTFSNESMYFNKSNKDSAGYWQDNMYIPYNPKVKDTVREYKKGGKTQWDNPQATVDTSKQGVSAGTKSSAKLTKAEKEDAKKRMDKTVDITRKATAIGSMIPIPFIQYPSIAINSALGAYDVYEDVKEGNYRQAVIDGVTAVPLPYISSAGYAPKIAAKLNRYNSATVGVNAVGAVDDWDGLQQQAMGGKIKRKKYVDGGITDADRQSYNAYVGGMKKLPGYDAVNWQHDQTFQKNAASQLGFDYSKAGAIQADMMARNQSMPGTIAGVQEGDAWGGDPNWVGDRERQKSYRKFSYEHYDKNNKLIGKIDPTFNPLTQEQSNQWAENNRSNQWQSNSNGVAMPGTNAPVQYDFGQPTASATPAKPLGLASNGFPTREEAIAKYKAKGATSVATGPAIDYSVDNVRAGNIDANEMAYYNAKNYDMNGQEMAKGGKVKRRLKKMGTGDIVSPDNPISGAVQMGAPTGTGPQGDSRWSQVAPPTPTPTVQPPVEAELSQPKEIVDVQRKKDFNVGFDLNLNTSGLISAADALVTNNIYNPQMRAMEANRQRAAQMRPTNNNNYIGGDMLTYARGGQVVDDYTMHPAFAKEEIEGGEMVRLPNGQTDMASGPKHYEGGIPTNLPEGTEVFSQQMYADKDFSSDVTNGKVTKRTKIAKLANMFSTKKEMELMKKPMDPIRERSLKATMDYKQTNLDQIFAYQEMMKNPEESVRGMMKMGGKKRCYAPGGTVNLPMDPLDPWRTTPGYASSPDGVSPENPIAGAVNMDPMRDILSPAYPTDKQPVYIDAPTDNSYERLVPYAGNRVTPPIKGPETITKTVKGKKKVFSLNEVGVSGMVPGAMAAINAITEHPIPLNLYQPQYAGRPEELNIDPILNRNLAQARALMTGNSGNRSVDQARALQALASVQNADTEAYGNKFNFDGQAKTAWRNKVADTNNQAQLYNLGQLDKMGDKRDQRQANKEAAFQAIANNAYTNSRKRLYDKHAQTLAQQFSPSYHYDPSTGFTYVEGADGQFHYVPIGQQSGLYNPNDGLKVTETTTTKNGKTQKRRSVKEDKNA